MTVFPTPLVAQLAQATRKRFYTAKLEGLTDQAAFEEVVRIILECYEETRPNTRLQR